MDELYCKLQQRKQNLKKLFTNMQVYQGDTIMADPDAPLPEGLKVSLLKPERNFTLHAVHRNKLKPYDFWGGIDGNFFLLSRFLSL